MHIQSHSRRRCGRDGDTYVPKPMFREVSIALPLATPCVQSSRGSVSGGYHHRHALEAPEIRVPPTLLASLAKWTRGMRLGVAWADALLVGTDDISPSLVVRASSAL